MSDPIAGNVMWVTSWLTTRFGGATRPRRLGRSYRWEVLREPDRANFEIAISLGAVARGRDWISRGLAEIEAHAGEGAPVRPAYYSLANRGVTIRGLRAVAIESAGQRIRCEQEREIVTGRSGRAPEASYWRIVVDDVDRGRAFAVEPGEDQESVARRALEFALGAGWIRVPPDPWIWSVLDPAGREWWLRLERRGEDVATAMPSATVLVLSRQPGGAEIELAWAAARPPGARQLRRIVATVAEAPPGG